MIKSPLTKKYLIIFLVILIIIIYGNLFFNVKNNTTINTAGSANKELSDSLNYQNAPDITFMGDFSDPFSGCQKVIEKPEPVTKTVPKYKSPVITLQGTVGNTAILNYKNKLYFIQEGDSLLQYLITDIYADSVTIIEGEEKSIIRINN